MPIPGTLAITGAIAPTSQLDDYPSHFAIYGSGGLRSVSSIVARDAIPPRRRESGMLVYVGGSTDRYFRLMPDLVTWQEFAPGGGGSGSGEYVRISGDTMTGVLLLSEHPIFSSPELQAATVGYVNSRLIRCRTLLSTGGLPLVGPSGVRITGLSCHRRFVERDGDDMLGALILSNDPVPGVDHPMTAVGYQWVLDQIATIQDNVMIHVQSTPVERLTLGHSFGRVPVVFLLDAAGRQMTAQVIPTPTAVDISFNEALTFTAVLK